MEKGRDDVQSNDVDTVQRVVAQERASTIAEAANVLRKGKVTSRVLTEEALDRIDNLDQQVGSFVSIFRTSALEAADRADAEFRDGRDRGPLQGIPLTVKDMITTIEGPTTCQSKVRHPVADYRIDASVVARLRAQGSVILGKTTMSEFAVGRVDQDAGYPEPRNPWNLACWPGGSSSGTASGIAAGLFLGGLGTDTGGSMRIPPAMCGVSGLKPTHGALPMDGCVPLAPSLDVIGPMARSAYDCALLFDALSSEELRVPDTQQTLGMTTGGLNGDLSGLRVGVERTHHLNSPANDAGLCDLLDDALEVLAQLGAIIEEVTIENYSEGTLASYMTLWAEGLASHRKLLATEWKQYGAATRLTLARGALYNAADYARVLRARHLSRSIVTNALEKFDVLVTPTVGIAAPTLTEDYFSRLIQTLYTSYWNLTGNPVISVPIGFNEQGLPLGMQIVGPLYDEANVLRVGDAYQGRTDWHLRHPRIDE